MEKLEDFDVNKVEDKIIVMAIKEKIDNKVRKQIRDDGLVVDTEAYKQWLSNQPSTLPC